VTDPGTTTPSDEDVQSLRTRIRYHVAAGYLDPDEIVEAAVDWLTDEVEPGVAEPLARTMLAEEIAAHRAAQATWPARTDYDRLSAAFAELNSAGIVAREDFACCQTCGNAEIGDEIAEAGGDPHGYTYFHQQDTEGAVELGELYLCYGTVRPDGPSAAEVGREVVEVLRRHQLDPRWTGDVSKRIKVPMVWLRRSSRD
jgi:hypothetical protein